MKRFATLLALVALFAAPLAFAGDPAPSAVKHTVPAGHPSGNHQNMMHQTGTNEKMGMMEQKGAESGTPAEMMAKMNSDSKALDQQFVDLDKQYQAMMKIDDMSTLKTQMQQFDQSLTNLRRHVMQHEQMQDEMQQKMQAMMTPDSHNTQQAVVTKK